MALGSAPAKRGCLWYVGIAGAGAFALLVLLIGALVFSPGTPTQTSIMVSATDHTYLEAVTENHGEGFLDGYDWLAIYYVQIGGWFQDTRRVKVYDNPHDSASDVGFHRNIDRFGQPQIVVMHHAKEDSTIAFVFTVPKDFDAFAVKR